MKVLSLRTNTPSSLDFFLQKSILSVLKTLKYLHLFYSYYIYFELDIIANRFLKYLFHVMFKIYLKLLLLLCCSDDL